MSSRSLDDLHPLLKPLCVSLLKLCSDHDIDVRVTFTYRSPATQNLLYAQGRTRPGKKVTNLTGNQSKHCFTINGRPAAKAFDIAVFEGGKYIADGSHELYGQAGRLGESLGLTWGGRWKDPFDPSHFEIP